MRATKRTTVQDRVEGRGGVFASRAREEIRGHRTRGDRVRLGPFTCVTHALPGKVNECNCTGATTFFLFSPPCFFLLLLLLLLRFLLPGGIAPELVSPFRLLLPLLLHADPFTLFTCGNRGINLSPVTRTPIESGRANANSRPPFSSSLLPSRFARFVASFTPARRFGTRLSFLCSRLLLANGGGNDAEWNFKVFRTTRAYWVQLCW